MEIQNDDSCLLCGKNNEYGLKLHFDIDKENQAAHAKVIIPKKFNGFNGVVHGGITCALLDEIGFYACRTLDVITVTMCLNTRFKKPVPIETELLLCGKIVKKRSRSITTYSEILLNNEVLASAEGEFFIKK